MCTIAILCRNIGPNIKIPIIIMVITLNIQFMHHIYNRIINFKQGFRLEYNPTPPCSLLLASNTIFLYLNPLLLVNITS